MSTIASTVYFRQLKLAIAISKLKDTILFYRDVSISYYSFTYLSLWACECVLSVTIEDSSFFQVPFIHIFKASYVFAKVVLTVQLVH